jgi:hypothetical protein
MRRVADTNITGSTGEQKGEQGPTRKNQGQWARPEGRHKSGQNGRHLSYQFSDLSLSGNEYQDRLIGLPLFYLKKTLKGLDIEGINTKAIIGLCGKGDQATLPKQTSCLLKRNRI